MTLAQIDTVMQAVYEDGGNPDMLVVSPSKKATFSDLASGSVVTNQLHMTSNAPKEARFFEFDFAKGKKVSINLDEEDLTIMYSQKLFDCAKSSSSAKRRRIRFCRDEYQLIGLRGPCGNLLDG